jgi:hypothetical protein
MYASPRKDTQAIPPRCAEWFATSRASPVRNFGASCADKQKPRGRDDKNKNRKIENPRDNASKENAREDAHQRQNHQIPPEPISLPLALIVAHPDGCRSNRVRFSDAIPVGPVTLTQSLSRHCNPKTF